MARYSVGLDFGTHQSKICIQDLGVQPHRYKFLEFKKLNGEQTVLFPSLVQINSDDTVSYGFTDKGRCKEPVRIFKPYNEPEPVFNIHKPVLELPKAPKESEFKCKINSLSDLRGLLDVNQLFSFNNALSSWQQKCDHLKFIYKNRLSSWKKRKEEFEIEYNKWLELKNEKTTVEDFHFRYFKMANFDNKYKIQFSKLHIISYFDVSVLYLTYILFCIREEIGDDYTIQIGAPSSYDIKDLGKKSYCAVKLLVSAYELLHYYNDMDSFLKATIKELQGVIMNINYNVEEYKQLADEKYFIGVIPEAYAGLKAVTSGRRVNNGLYLLVDIGGGTTDVVLFFVSIHNEPVLVTANSFPLGLNFVFEEIFKAHFKNNDFFDLNCIEYVQDNIMVLKETHNEFFGDATSNYCTELSKSMDDILKEMDKGYKSYKQNMISIQKMYDAIERQPIIFCGGGSSYKELRNVKFPYFRDSLVLDKKIMANSFLIDNDNIDHLLQILVVSFGLSHPIFEDVGMVPVCDCFKFLKNADIEHVDNSRFDSSDKEVLPRIKTGSSRP